MPNARIANVVLVRAVDGSAEAVTPINEGGLRYHTANKEWQQSSDGAPWLPLVPSFTRMFYVDVGTVVPVAQQTGSVAQPFSTIQAALTHGDTTLPFGTAFAVMVTPGVYSENIVLPDHEDVSIIGVDAASCILSEAVPGHTIAWNPSAINGPNIHHFLLAGMTVNNSTGGSDALHIDGSLVFAPTTFMDTDAEIRECFLNKTGAGSGFFLRCSGEWSIRRCTLNATAAPSKTLDVQNVTQLIVQTTALRGPATLDYTTTAIASAPARPGTGRGLYAYTDDTTDFNDAALAIVGYRTTLLGAPVFLVDESSGFVGEVSPTINPLTIDGSALAGSALPVLILPLIALNGTFGRPQTAGSGNVLLNIPPDVGVGVTFVDFSKGTFLGTVVINRLVAPFVFPPVLIGRRAAFFLTVNVNSGLATLNLDVRDCVLVQANIAVAGAATIDRSSHFISAPGPLLLGANVIPIVPPFPAAAANVNCALGYQVSATPNAAIVIAGSVPPATRLAGAFTVVAAGVGAGFDFLISRALT